MQILGTYILKVAYGHRRILSALSLFACLFLWAGYSHASVEIGNVSHSSAAAKSVTLKHHLSKGRNRIILAGVSIEARGKIGRAISVSYGGIEMLPVAGSHAFRKSKNGYSMSVEFFRLNEASMPLPGDYQFQLKHDGNEASVGVIQLNGVRQTVPEAITTKARGRISRINTRITTLTDNALILDVIATGHPERRAFLQIGKGQTRLWGISPPSSHSSASFRKTSTAGDYIQKWKTWGVNRVVHSVLALAPADKQIKSNRPPVPQAINEKVVLDASRKHVILKATDADKDKLTFKPLYLPDYVTLTDNGNNTATLDFSAGNKNVAGSAAVIGISDGKSIITVDLDLTVKADKKQELQLFVKSRLFRTVIPDEYPNGLRNPLKGFRSDHVENPYATVKRVHFKWSEIEKNEADTLDTILAVTNKKLKGYENRNIKVAPCVVLHTKTKKYWPEDMITDDYSSDQYKQRLTRLIERLGKAWNKDPRIGYIQTCIHGQWGEMWNPDPTPEIQKLMGDSFTKAFPDKKLLTRIPWYFEDYDFGTHWDSWGHPFQKNHREGIEKRDAWRTQMIDGEVAYDWGSLKNADQGSDPDDSIGDPAHKKYHIDLVRTLHGSNLNSISQYNQDNPVNIVHADELQKAMGYRFVVKRVSYPENITSNKPFSVSLDVVNTGSAPFYYNWPLEVRLLNSKTRKVVWKDTFSDVDIRQWLPGEQWSSDEDKYLVAPKTYSENGVFTLPSIPEGEYILALAILDPAGHVPSLRFAIKNYFAGGIHPIGKIGVNTALKDKTINYKFDNPAQDHSLRYQR